MSYLQVLFCQSLESQVQQLNFASDPKFESVEFSLESYQITEQDLESQSNASAGLLLLTPGIPSEAAQFRERPKYRIGRIFARILPNCAAGFRERACRTFRSYSATPGIASEKTHVRSN